MTELGKTRVIGLESTEIRRLRKNKSQASMTWQWIAQRLSVRILRQDRQPRSHRRLCMRSKPSQLGGEEKRALVLAGVAGLFPAHPRAQNGLEHVALEPS